MNLTIQNTYGTAHNVSPDNPAHVTSCDRYRIPLVATITPEIPNYADMVQMLKDNDHDTRPEGYGLAFLESEEFSATYFGSIDQVEQYKRDHAAGTATFDASQGVIYAQWPHGKGWDELLPRVYWNRTDYGAVADGVGLVTAFAHPVTPGAEVTVYEFEGRWLPDKDPVKMVTYHCTACHLDTFHDCGHVHENDGPGTRRWAARQARQHIVSAAKHGVNRDGRSACRPADPAMLRVVNAVATRQLGMSHNPLPDTHSALCAAQGPCSIVRELRAGARPDAYRA